MNTIEQKYAREIWRAIRTTATKYAQKQVDSFLHTTRADELFYSQTDVGKNRYGQVLFDLFEFVMDLTGEKLEIDYKPRSEFQTFPEMKDIWLYFINKLEDLENSKTTKKGIVIHFPTAKEH